MSTGQDFSIPSGDTVSPVISLTNADGSPLNLTTAYDILLIATINDSIELTKSYLTSGITFVSGGSNGQIYVNFLSSDFQDITGVFPYQMSVFESSGVASQVISDSSIWVTTSFRGNLS